MTIRSIAAASVVALALAGCGPKADSNMSANTTGEVDVAPTPAVDMALSPGQTFANAAAASDTFEIESSKAALAASGSPAVKKFAQMMIDAHTESTAKLKTATASASPAITPDPTLNADQETKLTALKAKSGGEFDASYIAAQKEGHQKTLDTLKAYSASGDVPSLKTFATGMVPTVTAHLNMANTLKP